MNYVYGCDLSHWDGTVVWTEWDHTFKYVFMKVTESSPGKPWHYDDPLAGQHWEGAGQEGLYRSPYHFWRYNGGTGLAQAQHFYDTWKSACAEFGNEAKLELPPVIDIEDMSAPKFASDMKYRIREMLDNTERIFGVRPIIYTARWYTDGWIGDCTFLSNYLLWLAQYTYNPNGYPTYFPRGLTKWTFWQYSDKAELSGVAENDECVDAFNGTQAQLEALLVNKPGLSDSEKLNRLWEAHPELHGG